MARRSPLTDFGFIRSEVAGRIPIVAVGVPAWGLRGGWRDYCIVNAPERSGPGAFVVLLALVSRRALVVAKRCGVRRATSGSSQRDRLRVEGSLARWLLRGRPNCQGVFDGAKRERVGRPEAVGLREAYRIARSGGLVRCSQTRAAGPRNPRCASIGGGGDCGDGAMFLRRWEGEAKNPDLGWSGSIRDRRWKPRYASAFYWRVRFPGEGFLSSSSFSQMAAQRSSKAGPLATMRMGLPSPALFRDGLSFPVSIRAQTS